MRADIPSSQSPFALLAALLLAAMCGLLAPFAMAQDYLAPEKAFAISARMTAPQTAEVSFKIADGYYMYRERFAFKAEGATVGEPVYPEGKIKYDETFQKDVESYRDVVHVIVPVQAAGPFTLTVTSQGCADAGLCYAPMDSRVELNPAVISASAMIDASSASGGFLDGEMNRIENALKGGSLLVIAPLFLLLGLGLAFTPCVLPMVPILSSIIVGDSAGKSRSRGLMLSGAYSLGMAIVYTLLGVAAGLAGEGLAAALQNPWVLSAFALLMVLLSLSMFGFYQLQMPAAIQQKLIRTSESQASGKLAGVFVMGALSALIVGPCVAAPLAGALVYISQTRDVVVGGAALFAMAAGMSVPLLLIGASAGVLLPRAGAWMEAVKRFFGVLMLATALWMISPVIPAEVAMLGWAALGIGYAVWLLKPKGGGWGAKTVGLVFAGLGLIQLAGVATGGRDALSPLAHLGNASVPHTEFVRIKSVAELDAMLQQAGGKTVMLDFYADWCVSCIEMEKFTFSDRRVRDHFDDMLLLQADVTANNADDKALLKRFGLFGPPGIIFFKQGREVEGARVIGFQKADKFMVTLSRLQAM